MISAELEKLYPSGKTLVKDRVASRIRAKDATLYSFSEQAQECASNYMGWVDLATNPPTSLREIQDYANDCIAHGLKTVVLIGQGGSTQAAMTLTKYNKVDSSNVKFITLDSDSPVRLREMLAHTDPRTALVLVQSKSGGTLEMRTVLRAVRAEFSKVLPADELPAHLIAVTDPGSSLERLAEKEGWAGVFLGEPTVGGRFSALSVFGLLSAALVGIDLESMMARAAAAERGCSEDSIDNPAIVLASFLYDNYVAGRDKFCFLTQKRGRVLGLWIEQLVAESLGKGGQGILPNIEVDSLMLKNDPGDRSVVMYQTKTDLWDELKNFEMSLSYVDSNIPRMSYRIDSVEELAEHFVMWEYAIAMCGYLMRVCPFDQPDVASAKAEVNEMLANGLPEPDFVQDCIGGVKMGQTEVRVSPQYAQCTTIYDSLYGLLGSLKHGDYFALNAFLPFTGEGRREALETIRRSVAEKRGVVSCLEVGPRYLHSTGQLQKGGPNTGAFLILSADELKDVHISSGPVESLSLLAEAQAAGDLVTLSSRGRRCVHLHLPDNSGVTLRCLADVVVRVLAQLDMEAQQAKSADEQGGVEEVDENPVQARHAQAAGQGIAE
ncbi:MAG: glucose-6-phosphate isomerase [Eggerthellaceae bacterium]|nr:glucose-6-phosphate isomerase [Eggerthellaceae bacterium]